MKAGKLIPSVPIIALRMGSPREACLRQRDWHLFAVIPQGLASESCAGSHRSRAKREPPSADPRALNSPSHKDIKQFEPRRLPAGRVLDAPSDGDLVPQKHSRKSNQRARTME